MKQLERYLLQEIIISIALVMVALLGMFSFFDLIQELDSLGKGNYGLGNVILFVLLSAPGHVYDIVPVAVLIGGMHALGQLARHSELVVMRVSGWSMQDFAKAVVKVGLVFTFVTFLIGEIVTPYTEKTAHRLRLKATDSVVAQEFKSGLWVKDGNSFVNVDDVMPDASLAKVIIYEFDERFTLQNITYAAHGSFEGDFWKLTNVTQTVFNQNTVHSVHLDEAHWTSVIRPELLSVLLVQPEKMSMINLYSYIKHLNENKQKVVRHEIAFLAKIIYPLASIVMIMLALPFGFLHQRAGGTSLKIFAGIMLGVVYQVLNRVFVHLGLLNDWSPLTSTVVPTMLFLAGALVMLWRVERQS